MYNLLYIAPCTPNSIINCVGDVFLFSVNVWNTFESLDVPGKWLALSWDQTNWPLLKQQLPTPYLAPPYIISVSSNFSVTLAIIYCPAFRFTLFQLWIISFHYIYYTFFLALYKCASYTISSWCWPFYTHTHTHSLTVLALHIDRLLHASLQCV